MGLRKHKFSIIVLSSVVLIGGGMIGYKFYQESKAEVQAKDFEFWGQSPGGVKRYFSGGLTFFF